MFRNPLLQYYRFSQLRPRQIGLYGVVYATLAALILGLNYTAFTLLRPWIKNLPELPFNVYLIVFAQFAGFQVILLWFWASYNAGSALTTEILRKSYLFLKLLPLTPCQKTWGMLLGVNFVPYGLALVNLVPLMIFAVLGYMPAALFGYILLGLAAVAFFLNPLTLLLSINPDVKHRRRFGTLILIIGVLWGLMFGLAWLVGLSSQNAQNGQAPTLETFMVPFFTLKIPGLLLFASLLSYLGAWLLCGITRKFRDEYAPMFSYPGAVLFGLIGQMLAIGFVWPFLPLKAAFYGHIGLSLAMFSAMIVGLLPPLQTYFEAARRIQTRPTAFALTLLRFCRHTTLFQGLGLFLIWVIFFVGLAPQAHLSCADYAYPLLNLGGFYLFFLTLAELFVLFRHLHVSLKALLFVIAGAACFLPGMLAQTLNRPSWHLHSVLGYWGSLLGPFIIPGGNASVQGRVLLVNMLFCLLPVILIVQQYGRILRLKKTT